MIAVNTNDYLALDLGNVRTGIARASTEARLPEPLGTIPTSRLLSYLRERIDTGGVEALVVGLPRNLKAEDTDQTKWARNLAEQLKKEFNLPVYLQDEALTTTIAKKREITGKTIDIDSEAAAIILGDFLETSPENRIRL